MNRLLRPLAVGLALIACAEVEPSLAAPAKARPNYARGRPSKLNLPTLERIVGRLLGDDSPDPAEAQPAAAGTKEPLPGGDVESESPSPDQADAGQEAADNLPQASSPTRIRATVAEPESPTLFRLKPEDHADLPPAIRSARAEPLQIEAAPTLPAEEAEPSRATRLPEPIVEQETPAEATNDRPSVKEPTPVVRVSPQGLSAPPAVSKVERRPVARPEAPRTSARNYLADEVRFGPVVRPRYDEKPRSGKLKTRPAESLLVERPKEPAPVASPEAPADADAEELKSLPAPAALPLAADDLAGYRLLRPLPAAGTPLEPASHEGSAAVSENASPAEILRTVHTFGAAAPRRPAAAKVPQAEPAPALADPAVDASTDSSDDSDDAETPPADDEVSLSLSEPAEPKAAKVLTMPQSTSPKPAAQSVRFKVRHGTVARVNRRSGHVVVHFPDGPALPVGSRLQVYRRVFFQRKHVGELEIVESQVQESLAQPLGKLGIEDIAPEDELVLVPIASQKAENPD